eukprot:2233774-Prorocentrum_lima.AAC.1
MCIRDREWPDEMGGAAEPKGGATGGTAAGRSRPTARAVAKPMTPMPTIMEVDIEGQSAAAAAPMDEDAGDQAASPLLFGGAIPVVKAQER